MGASAPDVVDQPVMDGGGGGRIHFISEIVPAAPRCRNVPAGGKKGKPAAAIKPE